MTCAQANELIQQSLDELLSPAERARLDDHLAGCAACRHAWDEYHRLAGQATAWVRGAGYGGEEIADRVMAAIGRAPAEERSDRVVAAHWAMPALLAAAAVAAAAMVGAGHIPAPWRPDLHWTPSMADLRSLEVPLTAPALRAPDVTGALSELGSLFAPLLRWSSVVIAVAAAANVALFVGTGNRRRGTPA